MAIKCTSCGFEDNEPNSRFCSACGSPLTPAAAPPVQPQQAPMQQQQAWMQQQQARMQQRYASVQNGMPQQMNQAGYGVMTQQAPKKKTGLIIGIVVGSLVLIGIIVFLVLTFLPKAQGHSLDGEYKLSRFVTDDEDYSPYLGFLDEGYHLTIDGTKCTLEIAGIKTSAEIDQEKHTISIASLEVLEFKVEGKDIILDYDGLTMVFTRQ